MPGQIPVKEGATSWAIMSRQLDRQSHMKKVLITGMSGLIGGAIQRQLEGTHSLRALNRRDVEGVREREPAGALQVRFPFAAKV